MGRRVKPPMQLRPVYVRFVSVRKCRYNPSWQRYDELPEIEKQTLWDQWAARRKQDIPKRLAESLPSLP